MFLFDGLFVSGENFFEPIKISAKNFCMAVKRILVFLRMGFDLILQKTLKKTMSLFGEDPCLTSYYKKR